MIEVISQPWPWFISGPLIAFVMIILLWLGGSFGISSTLRSICSIGGAGRVSDFFRFDWKSQVWNLIFVAGAIIGGYIAETFLKSPIPIAISKATIQELSELHIPFDGEIAPAILFSLESLTSVKNILLLVLGGFLVGFGTRWAGGCTSGHAISGLSNLQLPSLIAVIGFFVGGLIMTHLLFPLIF